MATIDVSSLSAFDWFLIALTTFSVVSAFRQGLVKVVFSLSGLIVGVLIASWVHDDVARSLQAAGGFQPSSQVLAFLAVVAVVYIGFMIAAAFAKRVALGAGMGAADRFLGAGFGLLRGGLTGAVILVTLTVAMPRATWIERSQLAPFVLEGTHAVSFIIPESFREGIDPQAAPSPGVLPTTNDALEARTVKQH